MSITILHKGIYDTIQDQGRYGNQHIGINPCGYVDFISASLANIIVGNPINHPCIEVFFPAASIQFNGDYTICIAGASFVPLINEHSIPLHQKIAVKAGDILRFLEPQKGNIAYVAIYGTLTATPWLDSFSESYSPLQHHQKLNWTPSAITSTKPINESLCQKLIDRIFNNEPIRFIPGPAWEDLAESSIVTLLNTPFTIGLQANRMSYPLKGPLLNNKRSNPYLSSGVTRGTIQLLPSGEIIVLMADHQTIGGYANLGQIILVDLPRLAQWNKHLPLRFKMSTIESAHSKYREIQQLFIH